METLAKVMNKARLQSFHLTLQANISLEHGSFITSHATLRIQFEILPHLCNLWEEVLSQVQLRLKTFFNSFLSLTQFSNYVLHGDCLESLLKMLIPIT